MRHHLTALLVFGVACATDRPNIVFLVADDMGWSDLGYTGGDIPTPNLDALAGQGVVLTRHYSQPSCSPSRTALMTGRYPIRSGMQSKPLPAGVPCSLPLSEKIFPQYFHELEYHTHLVGKWHLGYETTQHLPTRRGFDTFFGFLNGYLGYYDATHTHSGISGRDLWRNEEGVAMEAYGRYLTDVFTEEAVSVIEGHPHYGGLLLFLTYSAPHTGNLGAIREAPPGVPGNATMRQIYRGMVRSLDHSVGKLVKSIEKNGLLNNTIIVFLSDNGAPTEDPLYGYSNQGSNYPLRGEKLSIRDGGVRTPSFIWSSQFRKTARVSAQLFHITDWLPTLYSAAGGNISSAAGSVTLDGIDQWASLISSADPPRTELLVDANDLYHSESYILRKWKLVKDPPPDMATAFASAYYGEASKSSYNETEVSLSPVGKLLPSPKVSYSTVRENTALKGRCNDTEAALREDCSSKYCLYNLVEDPTECKNLAEQHPALVSRLVARLEEYKKVMVPSKNASMDPRSDPKYWNDYWSPWLKRPTTNTGSRVFGDPFFSVALFFSLLICPLKLYFYTGSYLL